MCDMPAWELPFSVMEFAGSNSVFMEFDSSYSEFMDSASYSAFMESTSSYSSFMESATSFSVSFDILSCNRSFQIGRYHRGKDEYAVCGYLLPGSKPIQSVHNKCHPMAHQEHDHPCLCGGCPVVASAKSLLQLSIRQD